MAVAEASAAQGAEAVSAGNRRKQQEICAELKAKVGSVTNVPHANLVFTATFKMNIRKNCSKSYSF